MAEEVDAYHSLDLSSGSQAGQALKEDAGEESDEPRLTLTGGGEGGEPHFLTPGMSQWFGNFVADKREAALNAIDDLFQKAGAAAGSDGIFVERRLNEIDDQTLDAKRAAMREHMQRNAAAYDRLNHLKRDAERARRAYQTLQAEHDRQPEVLGPFYWFMLFAIGVFEAFINFQAFNSLSFMTPFIALGSTAVVAVLLALSSHLHGAFITQWEYRTGPHRREGDKAAAAWMFSLGTVGMTMVLASVWYARANYLKEQILTTSIIGGDPPTWIATVGGSLFLNLAVYVAGVIISYFRHDEDPRFPKALHDRDRLAKRVYSLEQRLARPLNRTFARLDADADRQKRTARRMDRSLRGSASYNEARREFDKLAERDAEVAASLVTYRRTLFRQASRKGNQIVIEVPDPIRPDTTKEINPRTYEGNYRIIMRYL